MLCDQMTAKHSIFLLLAFRHAGACLTLLYNTVEENLRGMNERMTERQSLGLFTIRFVTIQPQRRLCLKIKEKDINVIDSTRLLGTIIQKDL